MSTLTDAPFLESVQCHVIGLLYEFTRHAGELVVPDHNCTDMQGCIALFQAIDPLVERIAVMDGPESQTLYTLCGDHWHVTVGRQ